MWLLKERKDKLLVVERGIILCAKLTELKADEMGQAGRVLNQAITEATIQ